ncbi:MAG: peptidase [Candidatus Thermoplasmatota archaeon]|nr:peptidase [Euryarchaeota archaeon]MBU4031274.1 peptidase [Candidatus Thermoplasmatota archaeon]MBU4071651.1 peptidase [Candidatus Thermoplasmatota archaeon]MBU4143453.1 peptidase [Candidatus Thermoplasmatota archaeon]MBU4592643.1 peptidase [Candidatus Thermoplasmatota archaeon]
MAELRVILPDDVDRYLESLIRTGMFGNKAELARAAIVHFLNTIGPISKGYDTETSFSPDGRIYQLEYARESIQRGRSVVGLVCSDGIVLATENQTDGPDILAVANPCLRKISDNIVIGYSGLAVDAMMVMDRLKPLDLKTEEKIISAIREIYWEHTLKRDTRPLGASLLVATNLSRPRLFEVDPSGIITECFAGAIGSGSDSSKSILVREYKSMAIKQTGKLIAMILGEGKKYSVETLLAE